MCLIMLFSTIFSISDAFSPLLTSSTNRSNRKVLPSTSVTSTKLNYSSAAAGPPPVAAGAPNSIFRNKMREILKEKPKGPTKVPEFITQVSTMQEFRQEVINEKDKVVVVRFYAPWCRACKAVAPLFYRYARQNSSNIKFVEVPVTKENAYLHQGLGVPSLPYGHIYHPTKGLVEELKLNKQEFKEFTSQVARYEASCAVSPSLLP